MRGPWGEFLQTAVMGRGRWLLVLALVAAVGLAVAACGGDDEPDAEPLKIGYLGDFSGPIAEFGPVIQTGVELAIEHINAAGGVLGQPVELVTGDTQVDTVQGVEEARRLVEVEGVHAIVGPLSSTVTIAVAESVTGPAGVPTISPSATSPSITVADDNGYLFRSTISDAAQGVALADLASDEGYDNVAVLFRNDAYGQGLADAFEAAFDGTVTSASIEQGATSYLSELRAAADGGATVLIAIAFPAEALIFIRESLEHSIFSEFLFVDGTKSQDLIDGIGEDFLNGSKGTAPGGGPANAATRAWDAAYIDAYGELPALPFVREAYDAVIAIALAAELAGSTDGAAIRDALPRVAAPGGDDVIPGPEGIATAMAAVGDGDDVNYEGAATTLDWNAAGDVLTGFIQIWQYSDGEPVEIDEVPFDLN
jgi:branched-chain amino acid transport system substrate-binding protein